MYEIHQIIIKDVAEKEELQIFYDNLRNPKLGGWKQEQVDQLEKTGLMEREGTLSDKQRLHEVIKIVPKFKIIEA